MPLHELAWRPGDPSAG